MTLYSSTADSANTSNCSGLCASNWPPYTVSSAANLGVAVGIAGKLGTNYPHGRLHPSNLQRHAFVFSVDDAEARDAAGVGGLA